MLRLMQTPVELVVVCMRAKYPMKEVEKNGRKEWTRSELLEPKQADDILFEMFVHGWMDDQHKFHGTKYTRDNMREIFVDGQPISIETGRKLAAWASGKNSAPQSLPNVKSADDAGTVRAEPTDESLIADIASWVKKRNYDMAFDLCRSIKDEQARTDTQARITAHQAKAAA